MRFRILYLWNMSGTGLPVGRIHHNTTKTTDWKNCATARSIMNPFKNPIRRIAVPNLDTNRPNTKLKRVSGNMHSIVKNREYGIQKMAKLKAKCLKNGEKSKKWQN